MSVQLIIDPNLDAADDDIASEMKRTGYKKGIQNCNRISEGKKRLWGPRPRWKDNIKKEFKEIACVCVNCIHLTQDRV
jgi:hypothetical protein